MDPQRISDYATAVASSAPYFACPPPKFGPFLPLRLSDDTDSDDPSDPDTPSGSPPPGHFLHRDPERDAATIARISQQLVEEDSLDPPTPWPYSSSYETFLFHTCGRYLRAFDRSPAFICDLCSQGGAGKRFFCITCNFRMCDLCAPKSLTESEGFNLASYAPRAPLRPKRLSFDAPLRSKSKPKVYKNTELAALLRDVHVLSQRGLVSLPVSEVRKLQLANFTN